MPDYAQELKKYPDASDEEKGELIKLAELQKDISIGQTAEDFVRHPFFKIFEDQMNEMINDTKGKLLKVTTIEELKAHQAAIEAIKELKQWINKKIIAKRVAAQAIDIHEKETEEINAKIQEAVDKSLS
jgi:hypothetical protein